MTGDTVLIATDGSASARLAVEVGLRLAREDGADVVFIHASPEISTELFDENAQTPDNPERIADSDPVLAEALQKAGDLGVEARLEVLAEHGTRSIADLIVGAAAGLDAGMIVLGSRGRGPVTEAVLGSVSRAVVANAAVPVVVVHSPAGD